VRHFIVHSPRAGQRSAPPLNRALGGTEVLFASSVIRKTGQWWKLAAATWALLIGVSTYLIAKLLPEAPAFALATAVGAVGIVVALFSVVLACYSIRCPSCGARWILLALSGQSVGGWGHWLMSLSACPKCNN